MMQKLIFIMIFFINVNQLSAAPKKSAKCVACVTQEQRNAVQKKLDDLRAKVRALEAENESLRNRPLRSSPAPTVYTAPRAVDFQREPSKKNRLSALAGWGPSAVTNRRKDLEGGNEVEVENGPLVGAMYQRLLGETISIGALITVPTYPDTKKPSYAGSLGFDF